MNWLWFSIGAIGGLYLLYARGGKRGRRRRARLNAPETTSSPRDQVEEAVISGNAEYMIQTLEKTDDPILRNMLLGQIVAEYYRQRSDADSKAEFYRYAQMHVEEIPGVLDALEANGQERPDSIETMKMIAIAMEQDGRLDEAVEICEKALSFGLQNGTKTGFEGRISRINRKREVETEVEADTEE